ncbi:phospholipase D-like domain-containing protein [Clostridium akagii]|uniref:phospholipase D-like domain-containing protein n=1 Tax=Clostridium akagii TaxID=91623 RepID=UPI00047985E4|nr:phospholipase D-like domain-containing protein [Clostridium akagii]
MNKKLICLISSITITVIFVTGCGNITTQNKKIENGKIQKVQVTSNNGSTNISSVSSGNVSYYFSNEKEHPDIQLINLINSSTKTLDIAIYSLTKKDIVNAIIQAKNRAVTVRLMTDRTEAKAISQREELQLIKNAEIPIKINTHSGLLHDKFTVVDGSVVATGSFNYTNNATYVNDENLIIIRNSNVAQGYDKNFNNMWNDNTNYTNY